MGIDLTVADPDSIARGDLERIGRVRDGFAGVKTLDA